MREVATSGVPAGDGPTGSGREGGGAVRLERVALVVAVAVAAAQIAYLALAPLDRITLYVNDDAYYYLLVARNWVTHGFPTFDGSSLTNGFQVLWQLLVLPFGLLGSKALQLRATLALGAALMQVGIVGFSAALGTLGGRRLGRAFLVVAEAHCLLVWTFALNGMESSLQAALLGVIAYVLALEAVGALARPEMLLGALAGLYGVSRLDGLALAPLLAAYLWAKGRRSARVWVGLAIAFVPAALAAAANLIATGAPLAVSSEVKLIPARAFGGHPLAHAAAGAVTVVKLAYYLASRAVGGYVFFAARALAVPHRLISWACAAAALAACVVVARWTLRRRLDRLAPLLPLAGALAVRVAFFGWAYPTTLHLFDWYWTDALFLLLTALAVVAAGLRPTRVAIVAAAAVVAVNFGAFLTNRENRAHLQPGEDAAAFVRSLGLPPSEAVGSWDAGYLAFLLDRPVINLDGLVNSYAYYRNVLVGREPLSRYLEARGVRYVLNPILSGPAALGAGFRGLRAGEFTVAFVSPVYRAPFGAVRQWAVLRLIPPVSVRDPRR